jgi:hypothetical protein
MKITDKSSTLSMQVGDISGWVARTILINQSQKKQSEILDEGKFWSIVYRRKNGTEIQPTNPGGTVEFLRLFLIIRQKNSNLPVRSVTPIQYTVGSDVALSDSHQMPSAPRQ